MSPHPVNPSTSAHEMEDCGNPGPPCLFSSKRVSTPTMSLRRVCFSQSEVEKDVHFQSVLGDGVHSYSELQKGVRLPMQGREASALVVWVRGRFALPSLRGGMHSH